MNLESIQKAYQRYARVYNLYFGWIFHPGRELAVSLVDSRPGNKILEVGVGTGLSLPLYPKHVHVTGIDISEPMLKQAIELKNELGLSHVDELLVMDAEHMSFADHSFDTVVAMYVATVVPDPVHFVQELKRVCKPGGQIIILNHFQNPKKLMGRLAGFAAPLSQFVGFRTNLTLDSFLESTGLVVKNQIPVNLLDLWTILVVENDQATS